MASTDELLKSLQDEFNNKPYDDSSIGKLEGEERVRTRPESLLGSKGLDGAKQTINEIIGNSTDEKLAGYGDTLIITKYDDGAISVRDFGRGVPMGWNEKKQDWNYHLIYEELYSGGKYNDKEKQEILKKINEAGVWEGFNLLNFKGMVSIGLNGVGGACTVGTSDYAEVISYREGKASKMRFDKGKHSWDELEITDTEEQTGTFVKWKPDDEVFTETKIPSRWLKNKCKQTSYVSHFNIKYYKEDVLEAEWEAKTIAEELAGDVDSVVSTTGFLHTVDSTGDICVCQAEIALGSKGRGAEYFHNMVEVNGGSHSLAYSSALNAFFTTEVSRDTGIRIKEADYSGKFSVIYSTMSNKMNVRGQTKDYLEDDFIFECLYNATYALLKDEYAKGSSWLASIIDDVVVNAQNRIAVAEMSKNLKEVERSIKKHKASDKFISCETYEEGNAEETEYFIVEGDSAGGRVKTARDQRFQCYLAIRGKSLNVYKATLAKLINNAEIRDMITSLGCGIDLGIDEYESFDISKLKVGKVIFLADADIDGKHILILLFLIFYRLFPELLYQGKVYIARTPLFCIHCTNDEMVYCMTEEEKEDKVKEIGQQNIIEVKRFKGLGETQEEDLWNTTLNPATRTLQQIKLDRNDTELTDALEVLFGKNTDRRKRAILGSIMDDYDGVLEEMDSLEEYINGLNLRDTIEYEEVAY